MPLKLEKAICFGSDVNCVLCRSVSGADRLAYKAAEESSEVGVEREVGKGDHQAVSYVLQSGCVGDRKVWIQEG